MAEAAVDVAELEGWSLRNTPHALEDGTPVAAWVRFSAEGAMATDLGRTLSRLGPLSPGLRLAVRALCRTNDVQIDRGELRVYVPPGGDVGEAVDRLAHVCAGITRLAA